MKFKVGDKVRVKSWSKMFEEFGADSDGVIHCRRGFVKHMECWCGKKMTIKEIIGDNEYVMEEDGGMWGWSDDMLEEAEK